MIVKTLIFWYSKQETCIKWGQTTSDYFTISNGVRQGSILSPHLFAVYVDDLSKQLIDARSGCFIEHQCINPIWSRGGGIFAPPPSRFFALLT